MTKVYLDVCCLNRPQDDQTQPRVRIETEAVLAILDKIHANEWTGIRSHVHVLENTACPDQSKRDAVEQSLLLMQEQGDWSEEIVQRAEEIAASGIKTLDALHVASAEFSQADVMLTTDDRLLRAVQRNSRQVFIRVLNSAVWLPEVLSP